jgi:hypothetical protein
MTSKLKRAFLDEAVDLLVRHFGHSKVSAALARANKGEGEAPAIPLPLTEAPARTPHVPSITEMLEQLRLRDAEKHRILAGFYTQLRDKSVLPESQDISQFAQIVGLKEIRGKSRKDMVPKLMRFLFEQPVERLQLDIKKAATVSEALRQQGFSVLTDKLMRER